MKTLQCGRFALELSRPLVMGILNVTPDSFSDGGRFNRIDDALARAEAMLAEGADILDIGGESTRPGAPFVSAEEEMARVLPVLEKLRGIGVPLSLDTRRAEVMREALLLGAVDLINDVSALEDEGALPLVAASRAAVCLMHKQGNPDTMQDRPEYGDVVAEVADYLKRRVQLCLDAGIVRERLLVDPGFGFGKTLEHNLALLKRLDEIERIAGAPQLVGLSRKSMLGAITGEREPSLRLGASVAAALESARRGAAVIRVHDVQATRQALQLWQALRDS
ncbi:dihydropteroate synthase [Chromobacterium violaceum]|uniref:Dihydropteroate synthase n=2 Tax=Chromobacterium violaceum TaxID=536 RepID=Q7NRI5_CHRVO|nr:dihydropteroate synthase [Chromobacterium violaceum]AAQ61458.1 dihydropteroate synthase [Chromobacterium violaceum ATCC 12472]KJH66059.1 dihydropteroate synthase [Chromobacterium violaceum]KMN50285.1 dihydropteroate synthase [Chromobacterium violaceum]KMN87627.1 dihydropteroate synthase [Chromobacterium violaceum]KMN90714.1 dihydropteroate synthase [Chromobacterium violaceum]